MEMAKLKDNQDRREEGWDLKSKTPGLSWPDTRASTVSASGSTGTWMIPEIQAVLSR